LESTAALDSNYRYTFAVKQYARSHHPPFLTAGLLLSGSLLASCAQPGPLYQYNVKPIDEIRIDGTVREGPGVELAMTWQTTVGTEACTQEQHWPFKGRDPKTIQLPIEEHSRAGEQVEWIVWRDLVLPGVCGWQLSAVLFKADRSPADLKSHENDLLWDRLAFICLHCSETLAQDCQRTCVANTIRENDNAEEPVQKRCKLGSIEAIHTV
jgi:hypothetical protein